MKNPILRFLSFVLLVSLVVITTGCATGNIEAGASRLKVSNPVGKSIDVTLPKNLDADNLQIVVNSKTGEYLLSADKFRTDASTVIDSGTKAQADALGKLAETVTKLAPLATQKPE